jgi:putative membrane-bound dehydrogenase-like protein
MRRFLSILSLIPILIASPAQAQKNFGFDNRKSSGQPYWKPEESVAKMKVADGFEVKLFAAEPDVVNPIAMTVDEKGRVWVIECFEYPKRTPNGKMPRDRIVILEDTDGDGICDKRTVFAEGKDFPVPFDMASGLEVGNGGVYVGAPPYLFFIENKNDKPGKFEVLLKGFGSQDTHETLNTFQWGPDGWLYGLHGVFTHSEVKPEQADGPGTRLNAAVWRLHPKTKKFEIFSEGTSNPWGMDWRNSDGQFILCCCVIPHLYHMVPGGIYRRQGGQSFNPYAYGEIKEICDHTFHKESGWAHAGLISLDTPIMPEKYRNSVIFGSIHGCSLKQNILKPNGSTFTASRGDDFLVSGDKNFRPINLRWGPNGEIYCIDWHDQNPCHQAAQDSWDYEHGRVYRIQTKGLKTKKAEDLGKKSDAELMAVLEEDNPYRYRTALRLIAERWDRFQKQLLDAPWRVGDKPRTLQIKNCVRTLAIQQKRVPTNYAKLSKVDFDDLAVGIGFMLTGESWGDNPTEKNEQLEFYSIVLSQYVRTMCDHPAIDSRITEELLPEIAKQTRCPATRRELAAAAIRIKGDIARIAHALLKRKEDAVDPIIPQLLWLAYEKSLMNATSAELTWLSENCAGNALVTDAVLPRAMRRLVATGKPEDLSACLKFASTLDDYAAKQRALEGLVLAMQGRTVDAPPEWKQAQAALALDTTREIRELAGKLAINFRDPVAAKRALAIFQDTAKPVKARIEAVRNLALARPDAALRPLVVLAVDTKADRDLRAEAIRALASFDHPDLAKDLLAAWPTYSTALKSEVVNALAGRKEWARALLEAVGAKQVAQTEINVNTILRIQALKDKRLDALVQKVWGRVQATPAELNALIDRTRRQLYTAPGSFERGKAVFAAQCAKCHKFEGQGFEVGPNIEGAARDIEYLLVNVLDPNRVIGAPYFIRTVTKLNGQNEIGILAAEDDQSLTLKTENGVLKVIAKKDIEDVRISEKSLMPEGFGSNIKIDEFRDLIRYVMANPFITEVEVMVSPPQFPQQIQRVTPTVGVPGRIPIPDGDFDVVIRATVRAPQAMKARLLVGVRNDFKASINNRSFAGTGSKAEAQPDQGSVEVELAEGNNQIELAFRTSGKGEAAYLRFHDPDRKLRYPEAVEKKK